MSSIVISHLLLAIFMKPDILSPNSHFVPFRFLVEVMIWKKKLDMERKLRDADKMWISELKTRHTDGLN